MVCIKTNKFFIKKNTIFFPNKEEINEMLNEEKNSVFYIFGCSDENNCFTEKGKTIREISWKYDLTEDDFFSKCNATIRNSIRRSEKEGISIKVFKGMEITDNLLDEFESACNLMFKLKNMKRKINKKLLKSCLMNDQLILSVSYKEEKPVSYHVYMADGENSILWHSCSSLYCENVSRNEIGRINRYHHYFDVEYFKNNSYKTYDWGGLESDDPEKANGIDAFKMSFPGGVVHYYTWIFTLNPLYRLLFRL